MHKRLTSIAFSFFVFIACLSFGFAQPNTDEVSIRMVHAPNKPLTTQWCFVVDNSHSMRDVFYKARAAFMEATSQPGDQLEYAIVAFNNQNMDRFREWEWASQDSFNRASEWIDSDSHGGVLSYCATAITTALRQEKDNLTVILVTDGGFTEVSRAGGDWNIVREIFSAGQQWRINRGLNQALVTCLGISNPRYRAGNKPSDEECQAFLAEIGQQYNGGYWLVTGAL